MPDQDLILHPYVLGLWLGDGSSIMNHISVHEEDAEIVEHLRACGVEAEYRLPHWRKGRIANVVIDPTFRMRREDGASLSDCFRSRFVKRLRKLDVLDNKHVPLEYMRASRWQRLELVRGLMDSDGTISPDGKRCEFSNADRGLIDAMVELLRGLGYKPAVYHGRARRKVFGDDGRMCAAAEYWRISWTGYAEEPMFRLSRKLARMRSIENGRPWKSRRRRIVTIRPVSSVPVRCIEVDSPSHLFLCGKGWIPTHNTEAGNNWIGFAIHQAPGPMLAVQPTVELAKRNSRQRIDPLIDESPELRERVKPARSRDAGQHDAVEGIRGRHPDHDGRELGGRAALDPGALHLPRRGRRLSGLGRRGRRPGDAGRGAVADLRPSAQGVPRLDADDPGSEPDRAGVRGQRPAPVLRAVPALRPDAVAEVRAAPLAEGPPGDGGISLRGLRDSPSPNTTRRRCWRRANGGRPRRPPIPSTVGYHLSALYSPIGWLSWERIVRAWDAAQGSDEAIKAFRNTILGETWVETGEAPDWQRLADRREAWARGNRARGAGCS